MPRRGLWIVPLLVGCIAAAAFVAMRLGGGLAGAVQRRNAVPTIEASELPMLPDVADSAIEPLAEPQEDARAEIARASAAYLAALLKSDAEAYAATYLDEALAMPPSGPIIRGRRALEEAMFATFATYRFLSAEMARIDVRLLGETAVETGHYRYDVACPATGVEQTLSGRYSIVWKRHENAWRIAFDTTQPGVFA